MTATPSSKLARISQPTACACATCQLSTMRAPHAHRRLVNAPRGAPTPGSGVLVAADRQCCRPEPQQPK